MFDMSSRVAGDEYGITHIFDPNETRRSLEVVGISQIPVHIAADDVEPPLRMRLLERTPLARRPADLCFDVNRLSTASRLAKGVDQVGALANVRSGCQQPVRPLAKPTSRLYAGRGTDDAGSLRWQ